MTNPVCPKTGASMHRGVRSLTLTYKGESITFDMPGWYCDASKESIHTGEDMKVSDRRNDKERSAFHQMYEMLIGGVAKLLDNKSGHEVAIKANLNGPVGKSENSTWQIVVDLIKNAFFKAILPSFEGEVTGSGKP